jgi:hypothetical protein
MLPPQTSRLEEKPVAPDNCEFAGLKYTLIENTDGIISDLRSMIQIWGPPSLGQWLTGQLYPIFGKKWWMQNRPYRFEARREYDWLFPPILTLKHIDAAAPPRDSAILSYPIRRYRLTSLMTGDLVTLEGFIVQKVDTENKVLTLSLGNTATFENQYRVKVKGIDPEKLYYPGEIVEALYGEVWETRDIHMMMAVRDLLPDFNPNDDFIPVTPDRVFRVNNPLKNYEQLLDWQINGVASKMHGDMHLGNIMIGPNNSPFLIDFGRAREGHALFDWASLEISLLSEVVMPVAGETWDDARQVIEYLMRINAGTPLLDQSLIATALAPVIEVRQIVYDIIQRCNEGMVDWREYYISLTMCALRAINWETMPPGSRRLMFLVAGLSIHELRDNPAYVGADTPSPDETDVNTNTSV